MNPEPQSINQNENSTIQAASDAAIIPDKTELDSAKSSNLPKILLVVFVILFLAATAAAAYFYLQTQKPAILDANPTPIPTQMTESPSLSPDPTAGWLTSTDSQYFTFKYPSAWAPIISQQYGNQELITINNPTKTVTLHIAQNQQEYGFGGPGNSIKSSSTLPLTFDKQNYDAKENVVENRAVFVDQKVTIGTKDFFILFGTGYPVNQDSKASLTDYQKDKTTILQILSTFKFTNQGTLTNSSSNDWDTYTNSDIGFNINYPSIWRTQEMESGVGFGPQEIGEDFLWGLNYYPTNTYTVKQVTDISGEQFPDRQQKSEESTINGVPATIVTTTTKTIPDWYAVDIIIKTDTYIFSISNGAITDEELNNMLKTRTAQDYNISFKEFYSTFTLIN